MKKKDFPKLTKKRTIFELLFFDFNFRCFIIPFAVALAVYTTVISHNYLRSICACVLIAILLSFVYYFVLCLIIGFISRTIAKIKSFLRLRYLPLTSEEIETVLGANSSPDDYIVFLNNFLSVKYIDFYFHDKNYDETMATIPKTLMKEIKTTISNYYEIGNKRFTLHQTNERVYIDLISTKFKKEIKND